MVGVENIEEDFYAICDRPSVRQVATEHGVKAYGGGWVSQDLMKQRPWYYVRVFAFDTQQHAVDFVPKLDNCTEFEFSSPESDVGGFEFGTYEDAMWNGSVHYGEIDTRRRLGASASAVLLSEAQMVTNQGGTDYSFRNKTYWSWDAFGTIVITVDVVQILDYQGYSESIVWNQERERVAHSEQEITLDDLRRIDPIITLIRDRLQDKDEPRFNAVYWQFQNAAAIPQGGANGGCRVLGMATESWDDFWDDLC